ncbi:MAG: EamA family transporter RarD [Spirochaetaceae bacterium]|nr:EamA family transporter RarD [Spirochaetaceae bacterium]
MENDREKAERSARVGTLAAFGAYGLWGLFPLYWKRLAGIDPVQILCHRIVWCAGLAVLLLALTRRLGALAALFKDLRRALAACASAVLITANWGVYIWAVNTGHVAESSLGYYINPLLSVALGALLLREKLDRWTIAAVAIAATGVCAASVFMGRPPWISLVLASSFALYGYVKKRAGLDPLTALAAETLVATPFALAFLISRGAAGQGAFGGSDPVATAMLVLAGPVTAIPLLFFATAANNISLTQMGFIQYLSPTLQLCLGVLVFGESVKAPMAVAFASVIGAVGVYAFTRGRASREAKRGK